MAQAKLAAQSPAGGSEPDKAQGMLDGLEKTLASLRDPSLGSDTRAATADRFATMAKLYGLLVRW
jgi:hypothetical protein